MPLTIKKHIVYPPKPEPQPEPHIVAHRPPTTQKTWRSWEIDLMNRFYREKGPAALAGKLGRTIDSVKGKARYLGLCE